MSKQTDKTESQPNFSLSKWSLNHSGKLMILGFGIFIISMTVITWDKQVENIEGFVEVMEISQKSNERFYQIRIDLRYGDDCDKLRDGIDSELGIGANPDSWFPSRDDTALKIGQQRYELLRCGQ